MSSGIPSFVAKTGMPTEFIQDGVAGFESCPGGGFPPAWQGVEPVTMSMLGRRSGLAGLSPGRLQPGMSETGGEVLSSEPESVDGS